MLHSIKTISVTNQRETCLAWDKSTGEHLTNAIVWHDTRTTKIAEEIIAKHNGDKECFREICGLPVNPYFSALKMKWIIENDEYINKKIGNDYYN